MTTSKVYKLVAVTFSVLKLIFGINDDWVVGVTYLTDTGAVQEFSVAGDCEDAVRLILAFLLSVLVV